MTKTVYIRTLGWPLVTVARDGAGCVKEGKWLGVKRLGQNRIRFKILLDVV